VANDLIPLSGDPNVTIHEGKALLCAVLPGPPPTGPEFVRWLNDYTGGDDPSLAREKSESRPTEGGGGHGEEGHLEVEE
jgi:hypothetical protein